MSKQMLNEGAKELLSCSKGILSQCETVLAFKRFDGSHTGKGVGLWLEAEHKSKGLLPNYVGFHCTDGASNALVLANEYEILTEMNRDCETNHHKCLAHQTNRSSKMASGTGDFKNCSNEALAEVLNKAHTIIAWVHRSSARIAMFRVAQVAKK